MLAHFMISTILTVAAFSDTAASSIGCPTRVCHSPQMGKMLLQTSGKVGKLHTAATTVDDSNFTLPPREKKAIDPMLSSNSTNLQSVRAKSLRANLNSTDLDALKQISLAEFVKEAGKKAVFDQTAFVTGLNEYVKSTDLSTALVSFLVPVASTLECGSACNAQPGDSRSHSMKWLQDIAPKTAVPDIFGLAGMAFPGLGLAVGLFASIMGDITDERGGSAAEQNLHDTIIENCKTLIRESNLKTSLEQERDSLKALLGEMSWVPPMLYSSSLDLQTSYFLILQNDLAKSMPRILGRCQDQPLSTDCKEWQHSGGSFLGMLHANVHIQVLNTIAALQPDLRENVFARIQELARSYYEVLKPGADEYINWRLKQVSDPTIKISPVLLVDQATDSVGGLNCGKTTALVTSYDEKEWRYSCKNGWFKGYGGWYKDIWRCERISGSPSSANVGARWNDIYNSMKDCVNTFKHGLKMDVQIQLGVPLNMLLKIGYGYATTASTIRVASKASMCLNAASGQLKIRDKIQLYPCTEAANERFFFRSSDSTIRVESKPSMCLNAASGQLKQGDDIILYPCTAAPNERFFFQSSDNTIRVESKPSLCLNAASGQLKTKDVLQLWSCTAAAHEQFTIRPDAIV
eukprot:TRINITY_DN8930_c0_g1_i1.p1 TRINITY_DN8930_c0_g1~~TRINITY_DN8930_c0_g1_i1.p1  ORF type:complete len:633 (+),score=85.62 TRINITY_DN8930_c0_g1_i1:99-1997(+)